METASSFGKLCGSARRKRLERARGRGSTAAHLPGISGSLPGDTERAQGRAPAPASPASGTTQIIPPLSSATLHVACFVVNAQCSSKHFLREFSVLKGCVHVCVCIYVYIHI